MTKSMQELVAALAGRRVAVIGDAMLDSYLTGSAHRVCQEAPVPIVDVGSREDLPGGAANVAANLQALGAEVCLLSVVGEDTEAAVLRGALAERGIADDGVRGRLDRRTLWKCRVMAGHQMAVRFDQGSTDAIDREAEDALLAAAERVLPQCEMLMVSDYGYGVLTPRVRQRLGQWQRQRRRVLAVDSKDLAAYRDAGVTMVKPNYREVLKLLGSGPSRLCRRWQDLARQRDRILDLTGAEIAAVTMDSEGALVFQRGAEPYRTYAQPAPQFHAAGAGDTFLSSFALALAAGAAPNLAAELASAAAAVVVSKQYTATCSAAELLQQLSGDRSRCDLGHLLPALESYRAQGKRIVLTNGCFDILHRGHITYLFQARSLGDVLVVGLNSDDSIRRIKGPNRPINGLADRAGVLSALSCVDHVVSFDDNTPHRLIEAIRPDVFVKGGDYTRQTLPEASLVEELGGTVKILPFVAERSTTGIIERICEAYGPRSNSPGRFPGDRENVQRDKRQLGRSQQRALR